MRRSRARRRLRLACYTLEIRKEEFDALIRRGCMHAKDREDVMAVTKALYRFLDSSLK
jgi:hypothetical protein